MHLWKRKEKNQISAGWCCTLAPGIRNFNEVGCAWACCTGSPADLGGVGSRKINTEVGQLQNCSASVWCAKKLGDNCIVGAFFGKEKETPLALVLLYITYSWVLLVQCAPRVSLVVLIWLRFKSWSYAKRQFDPGSVLAENHQHDQSCSHSCQLLLSQP